MYKLIFFIAFVALAQCKSNEVVSSEDTTIENVLAENRDTTTIEKLHFYRGDTLTTYITKIGDVVISKRTSKYRNGKEEMDRIAKSRHVRRKLGKDEMRSDMMMESSAVPESTPAMPPPPRGRIKPDMPQNPDAGQLTAGEWNDLNNWDDWKNLLNDNDYFSMQDKWGIYPTERYSVFVTNDKNIPLADVKVVLQDGKETIWSARTDQSGRAELWSGIMNKGDRAKAKLTARVYFEGVTHKMEVSKGRSVHMTVANSCNTATAVDIMFVVDATGSMGDEINYLKSEVKDVIKRATKSHEELDVRVGSVFYRDVNDSYLTTVSPLNSDLDNVYDFINEQGAAGGGDYPEAVDAAMEEALAQQWSNDAVARIIFLLLDAPPHEEVQVKSTLKDQIAEAAERGIKIIPITASGINRETEFLMKFMSIATNGTYVFITDDSGIGGKHLDPVVSDFEVEKLNDLMTRLIENYTTIKSCNEEIVINPEINIFPNPTSNFITVETQLGINEIRVISSTGKLMYKVDAVVGRQKIDLTQYVDGMYTVQCLGKDFTYSYPVIKVSQ